MAGTTRVDFASNAAPGNGASKTWRGGWMAFFAEGTFGGGTVKLQVQSPQTTWMDVTSGSLSAAGMVALNCPPGQYRVVIATATAVFAYGVEIPTPVR